MRRLLPLIALTAGIACSAAMATDVSPSDETITTDGPLRLLLTDAPTMGGILWALPNPTTQPSRLTVTSTRYGSQCRYAVSGHADVSATAITLRIVFAERLTQCTDEIRALSYSAEVSGLVPQFYDLVVIHEQIGQRDMLVARALPFPDPRWPDAFDAGR